MQAGRKKTLAKLIAEELKDSIYLDLELPSDTSKLQDPELYLSQFSDHLVIIDEIQNISEISGKFLRVTYKEDLIRGLLLRTDAFMKSSITPLNLRGNRGGYIIVVSHSLSPFSTLPSSI